MQLLIYTGHTSYTGHDRFDIRPEAADPEAQPFILRGLGLFAIYRKRGTVNDADWHIFEDHYNAALTDSFRRNRDAWDRLLSQAQITLVCSCQEVAQCHRRILALHLAQLGALYIGERWHGQIKRGPP